MVHRKCRRQNIGEAWEAEGQIQACGTTPLRVGEERGSKGGGQRKKYKRDAPAHALAVRRC